MPRALNGHTKSCTKDISNINQVHKYDLLITNATVYDGTDSCAQEIDVAVKKNKIVAIGQLEHRNASVIFDACGLALAPGFIDVHTHDDLELLRNPQMHYKLSQGVSTVIIGNCGISASPYIPHNSLPDPINLLGSKNEFVFQTLEDYIVAFKQIGPFVNTAALIGHTSLRAQVLSDLSKTANDKEIKQMAALLRNALTQGAKGLSTGLAYKNANAATPEEVNKLVAELKAFRGIYATHLRTEFDGIINALEEAFDAAKEAGTSLVISHLKCAGKNNWGRANEIIAHIDKQRDSHNVTCDCYPYSASSSTLDLSQVTADFPITITWSEPYPDKAKQTLNSIAKQWQLSLHEAAKRLQPAGAVYHGMLEKDVQQFLSAPFSMVGSDGLPCDPHPHPRLWGSFPRVLGHYSRDKKLFDLSKAIHKMTGLSAHNFQLHKRGFIKEDFYADLVLFDPEKIKDLADFSSPSQASIGIEKVWVNGQLSFQHSVTTKPLAQYSNGAGQFLRHHIT